MDVHHGSSVVASSESGPLHSFRSRLRRSKSAPETARATMVATRRPASPLDSPPAQPRRATHPSQGPRDEGW